MNDDDREIVSHLARMFGLVFVIGFLAYSWATWFTHHDARYDPRAYNLSGVR